MFRLGVVQMNGLSLFNAIYFSAHLQRDAENLTALQLFNFSHCLSPALLIPCYSFVTLTFALLFLCNS